MFGGYLKQVREEIGLTQKELATKLNLASAEFASIDPVTISRWERGTTAPTVIKAIKILRVLTTNLMPFLRQLPAKVDKNLLAEIAEYRFKSPWATLMASSYDVPTPAGEVLECPLLESDQDVYLANLKHFFSNIDLDNKLVVQVNAWVARMTQERNLRKQRELMLDGISTSDASKVKKLEDLVDKAKSDKVEVEYVERAEKLLG